MNKTGIPVGFKSGFGRELRSDPDPPDRIYTEPSRGPSLVGFDLFAAELENIDNLKGQGKGSKRRVVQVLANLLRVLIHTSPEDLVPALYLLTNM